MKFKLLGSFILLTIFSFTLIACVESPNAENQNGEQQDYDQFSHIDNYSELDTYDATGDMYLVYFYLPQCPACQDLFDDIEDFYHDHSDEYPMVFSYQTAGTPPANVSHVPSILVMQDGEVLDGPIVGPSSIRDLFTELTSGEYTP